MKIVLREDIDTLKWDDLVKKSKDNAVFSLSTYLDGTAEHWCVLVDDNYTKGIALPYTIRLGVKSCYTPIFVRYLQWFGEEDIQIQELVKIIQKEFVSGQLCTNLQTDSSPENEFVYQEIHYQENPIIGSQAKRMLSKFEKSDLLLHQEGNERDVLDIIRQELPQKIDSINKTSLLSLDRLIKGLKKENLLNVITVSEQEQIVGGLILVKFNNSLLYLKGAFTEESKKAGAMYAAMSLAIEKSKEEQLDFDFGGSRVDGVRRFNVNLGGKDKRYHSLEWDNSPVWFKMIKNAKKAWIKK